MSNLTQEEIEKLKALALAATPGPWFYQEDADAYTHIVRPENRPGHIVRQYAQDTSGQVEADARFTAAANPDAIRSLIAQLEARPAVVDAPTGKLTKAEARKILDLALDLEKTGRICSLTQGQERTDFVARNRNIQCALTDILDMLTEPAAPPSPAVEAVSEPDDEHPHADLIRELRQRAEAYPVEIFPDLTPEQHAHAGDSIITRCSAGMGRHFSDVLNRAADALSRSAPAPAIQAVSEKDEILALMGEMSKHPQLKSVIGREALILRCVRAALSSTNLQKLLKAPDCAAVILQAFSRDLNSSTKAAEGVSEWQPIETAPKDGKKIALYLPAPWVEVVIAQWFEPWSNWQRDDELPDPSRDEYCGIGCELPTHWMPLPAAPIRATPATKKE